jgi:hypothetical protein
MVYDLLRCLCARYRSWLLRAVCVFHVFPYSTKDHSESSAAKDARLNCVPRSVLCIRSLVLVFGEHDLFVIPPDTVHKFPLSHTTEESDHKTRVLCKLSARISSSTGEVRSSDLSLIRSSSPLRHRVMKVTVEWLAFLIRFREVSVSNFRSVSILTEVSRCFPQSMQTNVLVAPRIGRRLLHSARCAVHCSPSLCVWPAETVVG